ncbi:hypothetical protein BATDEDRAFT_87454 [Batrachochytrium dendrobatidis JAM81]|uniref:Exportin-T n=1 Tax=Batrachochytrium dendrobatidis (strain JAM81 / FGSC 10211) TaxID=684364 RepID=F4P041_BATDJ|nr:Ran GTPase-binding protein LOS1 [Batrachochytrium dendrobatidis JAM81]EGF81201.1 hypothetical protein BATDEDRAFT_87454 [Batrachochytrium dendrobatidis JAM81]KAK5669788.1 pre-tRNA nuclear export protein [Batrachochytrium dendrobatidis]|eukprot:XP_006678117.1 hypothetical protein BATDEDRAFT_87454 [Batrachochytrium dendrobatidis JAM81]
MEDLCRAVDVAFSHTAQPAIKAEATAYCNQVRESARGWELAVRILAAADTRQDSGSSYSLEVRFYCFQILEDMLRHRSDNLTQDEHLFIQQSIWELVRQYYSDPSRPSYLKNKLSVVIVLLFKAQYPTKWPTFFDQLLSLLSDSGAQRSLIMAFLHICAVIDEEVVCLYVPRTPEDVVRNNAIKDWMREGPVEALIRSWMSLLRSHYMSDAEITNACVGLFGVYASWADINLILQSEFVDALLGFLSVPDLRIAACDCIAEIVGKGMKVADKLQLLQLLRLPAIIDTFEYGPEDFDEQVAKLINCIGMELCHCCQEGQSSLERDQSLVVLQQVFPYLIKYLGNEYDDTVSALLPFVQALLLLMKRIKKSTVTSEQRKFLTQLLQVLVGKMKFLDDDEFRLGPDAGESEALFADLRKSFKALLESIASIDDGLFVSCISSTVLQNFELMIHGVQAGKAPQHILKWPDVEIALHLLHVFIEAKPFKASPIYILESGNLSPLGQMLSKLFECDAVSYPHISVPILYFEILVRYSQFFEQCPHYLPQALNAFIGARGLHHPNMAIRLRLNYLFLRFIKHLRQLIGTYADGILSSIEDLIVIVQRKPSLTDVSNGDTPSQLTKVTVVENSAEFDSQLYLFECAGHLISADLVEPSKRALLLGKILSPMIYVIESSMQQLLQGNPASQQITILLADTITAIGSVSKGFPDYVGDHLVANSADIAPSSQSSIKRIMETQVVQIFQEVLHRILLVLERLSDSSLIREASRSSLQCMVGCVGPVILDHLPTFLSAGLLSSTTATELIDFLPFIGLMIYKFKFSIADILVELWTPLREKIFLFLNQQAVGTDDIIQQISLRRSYLTLFTALFNSEMQAILTCSANVAHLSTTLMSIMLCLDENSDVTVHKLVFSLFSKMVYCWAGDDIQSSANAGTQQSGSHASDGHIVKPPVVGAARGRDATLKRTPLNGFNQFVFENILPIMFELPLRQSFNPADGQALVLLGEIASLHKVCVEVLGAEYVDFIAKNYLPSRGCPPETAQLFATNLLNLDKKELKKYIQTFVQATRSIPTR